VNEGGHGCKPLIGGDHVANAAVIGDGVIDGRGWAKLTGQNFTWWDLAEKARAGGNQNNPRLIVLSHCDNFTLYRVTLKNSPNFHVYYGNGNGFAALGVIIDTPKSARNSDGIDPGSSTNVTITLLHPYRRRQRGCQGQRPCFAHDHRAHSFLPPPRHIHRQ
jgi:polygalacturonase